jgi:diguanylate cyclase (GGDEF)-like protein
VIDLDGLKHINDTHGHIAGDSAIIATADTLRRRLRTTDTIARVGGDEFAVILTHTTARQANMLAAAFADAVRATTLNDAQAGFITASIGVAMFDSAPVVGQDVLATADKRMYAAKGAGGDGYVTVAEVGRARA